MVRLSRVPLVAFALSGVIWMAGPFIAHLLILDQLGVLVVVYVILGSVAIGMAGQRLLQVLTCLWAVAVLAFYWVLGGVGPPFTWGLSTLFGALIFGTLTFGAWVATAGLIWVFQRQFGGSS